MKSSKNSFKSHSLLLSDLTISSSLNFLYTLVVTNTSVKNNVAISIAHVYICNKDIIKTIHHIVNILSSEAKLLTIRYSINQAINIPSISKIIIITDFLHIVRKIFNLSLHPYQKHTTAISYKLRRFFINNINNSIKFWECPS